MSDTQDEDNFDLDDAQGFDEFDNEPTTLGSVIQDNPLAKVGIIFAAAALVFGIIILFGGSKERNIFSAQTQGSSVSGVPGTDDITQAMREAVQDENEQNYEAAIKNDNSAIPIPIDPPVDVLRRSPDEDEAEDPLQRWRRLQQERLNRELEKREVIQPATVPEDNQRAQAVASLAELMMSQMQSILERQGQMQWETMQVTQPDYLEMLAEEERRDLDTEIVGGDTDGDGEIDVEAEEIILPAGEIAYAQLITEANSDVPGPAVAQIVAGPLRGSRILGSFSVNNELITLNFDTIVIDGITYDISAVALDPATTLPGMATDVDHRYFRRVILPMAAAFVEGTAEAISESGRTTVTISGESVAEETEETDSEQEIASGITEASDKLGEILDDMAEVEPLVIIASGTPLGILFIDPVTRPLEDGDI